MRRRDVIGLLGGAAAAWPLAARAQLPSRIWRIGILHRVPPEVSTGFAAFRQGLGKLGYVDGQNSIVDYQWSDHGDRLASLAAALTEMKVDVIVVGDGTTAKIAKQTSETFR